MNASMGGLTIKQSYNEGRKAALAGKPIPIEIGRDATLRRHAYKSGYAAGIVERARKKDRIAAEVKP